MVILLWISTEIALFPVKRSRITTLVCAKRVIVRRILCVDTMNETMNAVVSTAETASWKLTKAKNATTPQATPSTTRQRVSAVPAEKIAHFAEISRSMETKPATARPDADTRLPLTPAPNAEMAMWKVPPASNVTMRIKTIPTTAPTTVKSHSAVTALSVPIYSFPKNATTAIRKMRMAAAVHVSWSSAVTA